MVVFSVYNILNDCELRVCCHFKYANIRKQTYIDAMYWEITQVCRRIGTSAAWVQISIYPMHTKTYMRTRYYLSQCILNGCTVTFWP